MEQFQNLLRAIASNAAGYAFEIALQTMCKDCMEVMETLQKKLQALNQGFANSCQLAKGIVNDVADAFDVAHKDKTSLIGTLNGIGDLFEMRSTATGTDTVKAAYDSATDEQKKELTGNLVWQALKRNGVAGFFSGGDNALLEAMLSLTGSVIVGPPVAAPPGGESNYQITRCAGTCSRPTTCCTAAAARSSACCRRLWRDRTASAALRPAGVRHGGDAEPELPARLGLGARGGGRGARPLRAARSAAADAAEWRVVEAAGQEERASRFRRQRRRRDGGLRGAAVARPRDAARRRREAQLRRYCELDTLAMVMVYEALADWIGPG